MLEKPEPERPGIKAKHSLCIGLTSGCPFGCLRAPGPSWLFVLQIEARVICPINKSSSTWSVHGLETAYRGEMKTRP